MPLAVIKSLILANPAAAWAISSLPPTLLPVRSPGFSKVNSSHHLQISVLKASWALPCSQNDIPDPWRSTDSPTVKADISPQQSGHPKSRLLPAFCLPLPRAFCSYFLQGLWAQILFPRSHPSHFYMWPTLVGLWDLNCLRLAFSNQSPDSHTPHHSFLHPIPGCLPDQQEPHFINISASALLVSHCEVKGYVWFITRVAPWLNEWMNR